MDEIIVKNEDGSTFTMRNPIVIIGKAKKDTHRSIELRGKRKKLAEWRLKKLSYYNIEVCEDGDLSFVKALDGKKVKITIEVLETK